jgi:TrmH family RNA methyltransferase
VAERCFVVEGPKLLQEALDAGVAVESVYWDPSATSGSASSGSPTASAAAVVSLVERCLSLGLRVFELEPGILARVADTVTPQPILAVVSMIDVALDDVVSASSVPGLTVVCATLRDPGNAGTVLRSAEASGAGAVVFCDDSVDVYNPKTVRASAGALFHVSVVAGGDTASVLDTLGRAGVWRLGTVARGGDDYSAVDLCRPTALVLGNEAHGLADEVAQRLDGNVTIPMSGRSESLNVGMAAAVVCFEAARQRRHRSMATGMSQGPERLQP